MPYKDPEMAKKNKREYYLKNKEHLKNKARKNYLKNKETIKARSKKWREEHRSESNKSKLKYKKNNPEKRSAHSKVSRAIKSGKLTKGDCSACGAKENIQGHHEDYTKPLDVIWFCVKCHGEYHRKQRELNSTEGKDNG